MGLHQAGFEVYGCDITFQPNYPFTFFQQDALTISLEGYDAFWASPPCQAYIWGTRKDREAHFPMLVEPIRKRLQATGKPYIIEEPVRKILIDPICLTGKMFNLRVIRRRYFECNFPLLIPRESNKGSIASGAFFTVAGHGGNSKSFKLKDWQEAMEIHWMTKDELTQAIPPAYAKFLGERLQQIAP